jgi:hypothetical protein
MKVKELTKQELQFTRTAIAFSICTKFPQIYSKTFGQKGFTMTEEEHLASEVLKVLLELEPSIQHKLEYYEG